MRLWIDTDVGTNPDDAIAVALACTHPDVMLAGVSTVGDPDGRRAAVARDVLADMGADPALVVSAESFRPDALRHAGADALLAIGPLTNVARIVEAGSHPARLVVMGGALRRVHHRDAWREIESNFAADPNAAAFVLARVDVLLVPLDVTHRVCLDDEQRGRLAARHESLGHALRSWPYAVCLHDPLALLALAGEPFFTIQSRRLDVDSSGRLIERVEGRPQRVVTDVDAVAAIARLFRLLDRSRY